MWLDTCTQPSDELLVSLRRCLRNTAKNSTPHQYRVEMVLLPAPCIALEMCHHATYPLEAGECPGPEAAHTTSRRHRWLLRNPSFLPSSHAPPRKKSAAVAGESQEHHSGLQDWVSSVHSAHQKCGYMGWLILAPLLRFCEALGPWLSRSCGGQGHAPATWVTWPFSFSRRTRKKVDGAS